VVRLEKEISDYQESARNLDVHKRQVARQREYNITNVEEWLHGSAKRVRVTTDFGASYFISSRGVLCKSYFVFEVPSL
jgi:hypothetical protein